MPDPRVLLIADVPRPNRCLAQNVCFAAYASPQKNAVRLQRIRRRRQGRPRLGPAPAPGGCPPDPDRGGGRSRPLAGAPVRGGKRPQGGLHRTAAGGGPRAPGAAAPPLPPARPTPPPRPRPPPLARRPPPPPPLPHPR